MLQPVAKITSLYLPWGYEDRCLAGDARARTRIPSPSFGAHQPFALCWPSASVPIRLTTSWRNGRVAILLKLLESQVTPELLSPICSRSVPARSGCVRCLLVPDRQWHPSLKAPSTSSASKQNVATFVLPGGPQHGPAREGACAAALPDDEIAGGVARSHYSFDGTKPDQIILTGTCCLPL